jgi:Ca-activated chloride channel family protein
LEASPGQAPGATDARSAEARGLPPDDTDVRQAERMLNRLQDKPGQALMPAYGQQQVVRDW